jgi:hypothetical protein
MRANAKTPAPEDPLEIVGVVLDRPMDRPGIEAMARTFIEEYALMGWAPGRILSLFRHPHYAGAHDAYEALGEERILALIREVTGPPEERPDA